MSPASLATEFPGSSSARQMLRVALAGNPNVGKTTLFNAITGLRHQVGNYAGTTIERRTGLVNLGPLSIQLADLPGCYSLAGAAPDEQIAAAELTALAADQSPPDLVICVVDATNLRRNLFLTHQILDLGIPVVVALNLIDEARDLGLALDPAQLASQLGAPVIGTVARRGEGVTDLLAAAANALQHSLQPPSLRWPDAVTEATQGVQQGILAAHGPALTPGQARRLLFNTHSGQNRLLGLAATTAPEIIEANRAIIRRAGLNPIPAESVVLYPLIDHALRGISLRLNRSTVRGSESIDSILTHRVWGLVVFIGLMVFVFQSLYAWAAPLMDGIEWAIGAFGTFLAPALARWPLAQSFIIDGVIAGVGSVAVFLPQIALLFLFLGLLEDSGYLARAAFIMDRALSWTGLSGKSFVPLLSCHACAIPGIMATRSIQDPKTRLITILIAPLMSCSARLPVYVLLIGAFVEPAYGALVAGLALLGAHLIGIVVALPGAFLLHRLLPPSESGGLLLELPPYRVPQFRTVLWRVGTKARDFLTQAGTIILAISIIVWALLSFPRADDASRETATAAFITQTAAAEQIPADTVAQRVTDPDDLLNNQLDHRLASVALEQSYLGQLGHALQPIFAPAGFDWKITVGIISSFPAREVIISTLGIIYGLGDDADAESPSLRDQLARQTWPDGSPVFTIASTTALIVFFALCMQCGATLAVIARESRPAFALLTFTTWTIVAWIAATATFQILSRL